MTPIMRSVHLISGQSWTYLCGGDELIFCADDSKTQGIGTWEVKTEKFLRGNSPRTPPEELVLKLERCSS